MKWSEATVSLLKGKEVDKFYAMFVLSLFTGFSMFFLMTASYTIFLTSHSAELLAYTYVGVAVLSPIIGLLYKKMSEFFPYYQMQRLTLLAIALSLLLFRSLLEIAPFVFSFLIVIYSTIAINFFKLFFWGLSSHLFKVRESKKKLGIIGSGQLVAFITGGLLISPLTRYVGLKNFLIVASIFSLFTLLFLNRSILSKRVIQELSFVTRENRMNRGNLGEFYKNKYILCIFLFVFLGYLSYYFLENSFNIVIQRKYVDKVELSRFLGHFFAAANFVTLISQFLERYFFAKLGLRGGLISYSGIIAITAIPTIAVGSVMGEVELFIWLVILMKFFDRILTDSIDKTSMVLLTQPLYDSLKNNVFLISRSIINPLSALFAGVTLYFLINILQFGVLQLLISLFPILVSAIILGLVLFQMNKKYLLESISSHFVRGSNLFYEDRTMVNLLKETILRGKIEEVIYAMMLMEKLDPNLLVKHFKILTEHPSPIVRKESLLKIGPMLPKEELGYIRERMREEEETEVKGAFLITLAELGGETYIEELIPYVEHRDEKIRIEAYNAILRCGIKGVLFIGGNVLEMAEAKSPMERAFVARLIGRVKYNFFSPTLSKLIVDKDIEVRKEALLAASVINCKNLLPPILQNLDDKKLKRELISALAAQGEATLTAISHYQKENTVDYRQEKIFINAVERISSPQSITFLLTKITNEDPTVRSKALQALSRQKYIPKRKEREALKRQIIAELRDILWLCRVIEIVGERGILSTFSVKNNDQRKSGNWTRSRQSDRENLIGVERSHPEGSMQQAEHVPREKSKVKGRDAYQLLASDLEEEREIGVKRIFFLMSFFHPKDPIMQLWDCIELKQSNKTEDAIEVLQNILSGIFSDIIIALVEVSNNRKLLNALTQFLESDLKAYTAKRKAHASGRGWRKMGKNHNQNPSDERLTSADTPLQSFENLSCKANDSYIARSVESVEELVDLPLPPSRRWIVAYVLYAMGKEGRKLSFDLYCRLLNEKSRIVQNSAIWSIALFYSEKMKTMNEKMKASLADEIEKYRPCKEMKTLPLSLIDKLYILKKNSLFYAVSSFALFDILEEAKEVSFKKGEKLISQGDPGELITIIISGKVSVADNDGNEVVKLGDYSILGEMSLFEPTTYSLNCIALSDLYAFQISHKFLRHWMKQHPNFTRTILTVIIDRLTKSTRQFVSEKDGESEKLPKKEKFVRETFSSKKYFFQPFIEFLKKCPKALKEVNQSHLDREHEKRESLCTLEKFIFLRKLKLFERVREEHLFQIAEATDELFFSKGCQIVTEGDLGDCIYFVVDGEIELSMGGKIIGKYKKNSFIGEYSLLSNGVRACSATSLTPLWTLKLDKMHFNQLVEQHGEIVYNLGVALVQRQKEILKYFRPSSKSEL